MEPRGKILMLYTPWHEDDLGQRILRMAADGEMEPWTVLRMPAIAESQEERDEYAEEFGLPLGQPDPIGRMEGEALWPARYPIKALRLKQLPDPEHFEALFQGRPKRRSGSFFQAHWWSDPDKGVDNYVSCVPEDMGRIERCRYWDRAGSHRKGDYTAGVLMARVGVTYYIEDVVEGQWAAGERDAVIRAVAKADAQRRGDQLVIRGEQEPGSSGQDAALAFVTMLAGYDVSCKVVSGDKEARARTLASQSQVGNVKIVRGPWNKRLMQQFTSFPKGKNDDIVDAASGAFNALANVVHTVFRRRSPTSGYQGIVTR
jgi:predicted phage terminase large subunit-like protein